MKHVILFLFLFIATIQLQAQSISKQVIGNSGQALSNNINTINFTIGEVIVGTIENESAIHQGFWAELNNDGTLSVETLTEYKEQISIFPNPVVNLLQIKYKHQNADNYALQLYAVNGKQILNVNAFHKGQITQTDISHLSQGMYLLRITDKNSNYNKSFKILKK